MFPLVFVLQSSQAVVDAKKTETFTKKSFESWLKQNHLKVNKEVCRRQLFELEQKW